MKWLVYKGDDGQWVASSPAVYPIIGRSVFLFFGWRAAFDFAECLARSGWGTRP